MPSVRNIIAEGVDVANNSLQTVSEFQQEGNPTRNYHRSGRIRSSEVSDSVGVSEKEL